MKIELDDDLIVILTVIIAFCLLLAALVAGCRITETEKTKREIHKPATNSTNEHNQ